MLDIKKVALSALSIMLWLNLSVYAHAFDCKKAYYPSEKTICKTKSLMALDKKMASSYYSVLRSINPKHKKNFRKNQIKWVSARNGCKGDVACLTDFYRNWMDEYKKFLKRKARKRKGKKTASKQKVVKKSLKPKKVSKKNKGTIKKKVTPKKT